MGAIYSRTSLSMAFNPNETIVALLNAEDSAETIETALTHQSAFNSYGASMSIKGGFRYLFAGMGLGVHYSDYGRFPLFFEEYLDLSGVTIVPNVFVEGRY